MSDVKFPDISDFYTAEKAKAEEIAWISESVHGRHLEFLLPRIKRDVIKTVCEFGSGAGIVAKSIKKHIDRYVGIDMNDHFLASAKKRNPDLEFVKASVRDWEPEPVQWPFDLALASAFFKHFALDEWDDIVKRVLRRGRFACFDVQLCEVEHDDGTDYHHVFVTEQHVLSAVTTAGHVIVDKEVRHGWTLVSKGLAASDQILWTRRKA